MSSSYNTPCSKHKLVVSIYTNTETSLSMSTLAIWSRIVQSRDVRSHVFTRPVAKSFALFSSIWRFSCCCRAALDVSEVIRFECSKN